MSDDSSRTKPVDSPLRVSELEQEVRDLQRLQEVTLRLMQRQGSGGIANEILDSVLEAVGATRGFIWLEGGGMVKARVVASRGDGEGAETGLSVAEASPGTERVALAVGGRPLGGLVVGWGTERAVGTRERRLLERYAQMAANLLGQKAAGLPGGDESLHRVLALVPAGIYLCDAAGRVTFFNRRAAELWRAEPKLEGEVDRRPPCARIIFAGGEAGAEKPMTRALRTGEPVRDLELTVERLDGTRFEANLSIDLLRDDRGAVVGAINVFQDITSRKHAVAALRAKEAQLSFVTDIAPVMLTQCSADERFVLANQAYLERRQLAAEQVIGRPVREVLGEATYEAVRPHITRVLTGEPAEFEVAVDYPEIGRRIIAGAYAPDRDERGRVRGWVGALTDVTEQRRAAEELRGTLDALTSHIAILDRRGVILAINRSWRQFAEQNGFNGQNWGIGSNYLEAFAATPTEPCGPDESGAALVQGVRDVMEGRSELFTREYPCHGPTARRWFVMRVTRFGDGEGLRVVMAHENVTERRLAEEALRESEARFRTLASHAPVGIFLSDLAGRCSFHRSLRDTLDTLRADLAEKRLEVAIELRATRTTVHGDPVRLQQVWWNVLKNAVKFTPERGRVAVRTRDDAGGERVVIEISDSGIGMTPAERARAFEAFSQGEHAQAGAPHRFGGVGLGLAISRMLVEMHEGRIEAASDGRDRGTTITVTLPLATGTSPGGRGPAVEVPGGVGAAERTGEVLRGRILLVEDHDPTRTALAQLLTRRRYEVVAAASLQEARMLAAAGGMDLLISDIGLPDGSGYELMAELRERQGVRGIALSGYGMEHDVAKSRAAGFVVHLIKPVTVQALDRALAEVKAGPAGEGESLRRGAAAKR